MQKLKDVMSGNVELVSPETTLQDAAALMRDRHIGMLPVGENDRLVGTITDRDIAVRAVAEGMNCEASVSEVMTEDLVWAFEDDTVEDAARKMSEHQVRRLPVINQDKRLVGIVSLGDFAVEGDDLYISAQALEEISRD